MSKNIITPVLTLLSSTICPLLAQADQSIDLSQKKRTDTRGV
jgi:hypothetical protein